MEADARRRSAILDVRMADVADNSDVWVYGCCRILVAGHCSRVCIPVCVPVCRFRVYPVFLVCLSWDCCRGGDGFRCFRVCPVCWSRDYCSYALLCFPVPDGPWMCSVDYCFCNPCYVGHIYLETLILGTASRLRSDSSLFSNEKVSLSCLFNGLKINTSKNQTILLVVGLMEISCCRVICSGPDIGCPRVRWFI